MSSIRSSRSAPWPGAGPASVVDAFFRSSRSADRPRAKTASVMPVSGNAEPEGVDSGPGAGALLLGLVDDHVDERAARLLVGLREHLGRDLDEERVEVAGVPLLEDLRDRRGVQARDVGEQVVRLGDELDVGVLDAVVHHLDVVPGATGADVHAARGVVDDGRDRGEDLLHLGVGGGVAAGHDARPEQRTLLAAGHADTHEADAVRGALLGAAHGVREVRVAGVDDDVALVEQRGELLDHGVHRLARLDHHDDLARGLQRGDEVFGRLTAGERALVAVLLHELRRLRRRPVVHGGRSPRRAMLRARLAPITASPVTPMRAPAVRRCPVGSLISSPSLGTGAPSHAGAPTVTDAHVTTSVAAAHDREGSLPQIGNGRERCRARGCTPSQTRAHRRRGARPCRAVHRGRSQPPADVGGRLYGVTTWIAECHDRGSPLSAPCACMITWQAWRMSWRRS